MYALAFELCMQLFLATLPSTLYCSTLYTYMYMYIHMHMYCIYMYMYRIPSTRLLPLTTCSASRMVRWSPRCTFRTQCSILYLQT